MMFHKLRSTVIFVLLAAGVFLFQYTQLENKTTVLSNDYASTIDEKHMLFFSEVAYYYYYYRQLAEAADFSEAFEQLKHDNRFTYPDEINITTKITAWQEIIGAWLYHKLKPSLNPLEFYVQFIIAFHAMLAVYLFCAVRLFTGSTWLGIASAGWYYALQELANRLPYQPNLRENFGVPMLILALILTLFYIKNKDNRLLLFIGLSVFLHGLFWQFSVVTQAIKIVCLFIFMLFRPENRKSIRNLLIMDLAAYSLLVLIFWQNQFYATPMYLAPLAALLILTIIPQQKRVATGLLFIAGSAGIYLFIKYTIGMAASTHLIEFFFDRFFGIKTYNSQLYRTVNAFNSMTGYHYAFLTKMMLIPLFIVSLLITARLWVIKKLNDHELLLLILCVAYAGLAACVLRFGMIVIPLMIVFSMIMLGKFRGDVPEDLCDYPPFNKFLYNGSLCLLAAVFYMNIHHFDKVVPQQINFIAMSIREDLSGRVDPDDVIAADMVNSSSLAHLIDNPLIIHPQYEYEDNRRRDKEYTKAYGYTETEYMYDFFKSMNVDYVVLTSGRCFNDAGSSGINMREAIHFDFPKQTDDIFCQRDFTASLYFTVIAQNGHYRILKVN